MDERKSVKKPINRRARAVLAIGIALVIVGVLCFLATQITTSHYYMPYQPDAHGGILPIPRWHTTYPYQSLWIPGVIMLIVGPIAIVSSIIMRKRDKRRSSGDEHRTAHDSPISDGRHPAPPVHELTLPEQTMGQEKALDRKYCRYCGQSIPLDSGFCEKCGGRLN